MTRPFFTRERITHFELFGRHGDRAIDQMKSRLKSGYAVDFQVPSLCQSNIVPYDKLRI